MGKLRLDKYLAEMGLGTRSEVKKLLRQGQVLVNGQKMKSPEYKIEPGEDKVEAQGKEVSYVKYEYFMLHKPQGVITATEDRGQKTVMEFIRSGKRKDLFPVGRLDKDTEGLLLITNDGELAHRLLSPKRHVDKTYFVRLKEPVEESHIERLETGVDIGEERLTLPARLSRISQDRKELCITIQEGKFHQIKRMFQAVDNEVLYLKRLSMGSLTLDDRLRPGEYRALTEEEITRLKEHAEKHKSSDI